MNKLNLRKFDANKMKPSRVTYILGPKQSGKTCLQRTLMQYNNAEFGLAMSPTVSTLEMFRMHMPESWIYDSLDHAKIEAVLSAQRNYLKQGKKARRIFLTLDDCVFEKKCLATKAAREIHIQHDYRRDLLV